jgi:hypothetical protein
MGVDGKGRSAAMEAVGIDEDAPMGSVWILPLYVPNKSQHRSHTLPLIKYRPSSFGIFVPTGLVLFPEFSLYHATEPISLLPA